MPNNYLQKLLHEHVRIKAAGGPKMAICSSWKEAFLLQVEAISLAHSPIEAPVECQSRDLSQCQEID